MIADLPCSKRPQVLKTLELAEILVAQSWDVRYEAVFLSRDSGQRVGNRQRLLCLVQVRVTDRP